MPTHRVAEPDPLRGSIDLLILKALSLEPMHGWGIGSRIQQMSRGRLDVNQGSLYPALQRLEHRGDIEYSHRTPWPTSPTERKADEHRQRQERRHDRERTTR